MKRKTLVLMGIVMTAILVLSVAATATIFIPSIAKVEEKTESPTLDKQAPPDLQKKLFIHYKKDKSSAKGKPDKPPKTPKCYDFIRKNVRWENAEDYYVSPALAALYWSVIDISANTWDSETRSSIFGNSYEGEYSWGVLDDKNAITLGNYADPDVIAVTAVWWNPRSKAIVEYDIMFDTDWTWGNCEGGETDTMDLQNIATHEFGHAAGLDDIYKTACSEVTMYGYSDYGEIKKRDLEEADRTGIQELYGA